MKWQDLKSHLAAPLFKAKRSAVNLAVNRPYHNSQPKKVIVLMTFFIFYKIHIIYYLIDERVVCKMA